MIAETRTLQAEIRALRQDIRLLRLEVDQLRVMHLMRQALQDIGAHSMTSTDRELAATALDAELVSDHLATATVALTTIAYRDANGPDQATAKTALAQMDEADAERRVS